MINRFGEIRVGNWSALRVRNRDERHMRKSAIERKQVRQVLPAVQGRQRLGADVAKQRHMERVDMEMQDVEAARDSADLVEHDHVMRNIILDRGIQTYRFCRAGNQVGGSDGIATREKGHFVAFSHERFAKMGDYALCSPVKPRGHTFHQGRNLSDLHVTVPLR